MTTTTVKVDIPTHQLIKKVQSELYSVLGAEPTITETTSRIVSYFIEHKGWKVAEVAAE